MAYRANRNNSSNIDSYDNSNEGTDIAAAQREHKEKQQEATKKNLKTGAKAAGAYFGKGAGAKAVDTAANTKAGDKILNKGAELINKNKHLANASEKLNDSGITDLADKVIDKTADGKSPGIQTPSSNVSETPDKNKDTGDKKSPGFLDSNKEDKNKKDNNDSQDDSGGVEPNRGLLKILRKNALVTALVIGIPALLILSFGIVFMAIVGTQNSDFEDALAISSYSGGETGYNSYNSTNDSKRAFLERVVSATGDDGELDEDSSYESSTESPYLIVVATVHTIQSMDSTYNYEYFTNSKIRQIKRAIASDEESTKANLANDIFPKYFEGLSQGEYEHLADSTFQYIRNYYSYIGVDKKDTDNCESITSSECSYGIKGFYVKGKGNVKEKLNLSNVKVKIVDCSNRNKAVSSESLIDFEKYVLGVAYAEFENASEEAFKTQLIVTRNFALARHIELGTKIKKQGSNTIIEMASCTKDQVYCDPDEGCSIKGSNVISGQSGKKYKGPLSNDNKLRTYAKAVEGEVLINDQGYVVYTTYTSTEQNKFNSLAKKGKDYKEILLQVYKQKNQYANITGIKNGTCFEKTNCIEFGSAASGNYTTWKQTNKAWSSVPLGNSSTNIGRSGCTVTSIAIQIKRSGVDTSKVGANFNPGTFVRALNKVNGFTASGAIYWNKVTEVVPGFKYIGARSIKSKSQDEKLAILRNLIKDGYYVVAEVKGATPNNEHWVAINQVNGNTITMMDPGSSKTNMWKEYSPSKTSTYVYFKA